MVVSKTLAHLPEFLLREYFPLGDDMYPKLLEELKKAERYIFMEYFIVEEGEMWDSVLEILKEKASQGVEVRFMYDLSLIHI